ncbi:hypothetical protein TorRG33x02_153100 [Trema orientale]|uniref:DUF4220 domain-containing protein n=1 Tax=Trema orientale TaxID=63057 RepID=A0A2P5ETT1_TREOI|nr:hypothetical protein TorRG33x02_153100 [Trema orientale]
MAHVFPKSLTKHWTEWRTPLMILVSLFFQTILILAGSRRKYISKIWVRFFIWLAYLSADWIAMLSLSSISNSRTSEDGPTKPNHTITAFWASLLLLHLGGPDTITAYSLEDNEIWWRYFVVLSIQVIASFFIILNAWSSNWLNFLSVPLLVAGIFKFGQKSWVLMRASSEHFRKSMFPSPDPGPNYARYMDEYSSRKAQGFKVRPKRIDDVPKVGHHLYTVPANIKIPYAKSLQDAYAFFEIFKPLFADLILSIHDMVNSQSFFQNGRCEEVFRVIEMELGFMYDVFYTKAVAVFSVVGGFLRLVSFFCVVSVLVAFSVIEKQGYSGKHVAITYILLGGAALLEIYVLLFLLCSDWTLLWMSKHKNIAVDLLYQVISSISKFSVFKYKRWSNSIGQFNLIGFCLDYKPSKCSLYLRHSISVYEQLVYEHHYKRLSIPDELKKVIFDQLLKKFDSVTGLSACRKLCDHRGEWVLNEEECDPRLGWSVKVEFDESILLWHIATDLCYHSDMDETSNNPQLNQNSNGVDRPNSKEISKFLSEYMMYILVMRPFMLPNGIGQIRFQDTCAEAAEFFKERKSIADVKKKAREALLKVSTEVLPSEVKGDRSKSVLFDACGLAKALRSLETEQNWHREKKWELMSHVWVEILCYAASQCQRNQHAQQLRRGGELLTHVWLLMAHLGITKQFQIADGHARTKLILE